MLRHHHKRGAIHIEGERSRIMSQIHGRLAFILSFFVIGYLFLAARAFDLAVVQGAFLKIDQDAQIEEYAENIQNKLQAPTNKTTFRRGKILDRNGVLLASSLPSFSLYADPTLILDPAKTAQDLTRIFPDLNVERVHKKLTAGGRFSWITHHITPVEQAAILELGQPGLGFKKSVRRFYPHGSLFSHLVGYTSVDNEGLGGLERAFEKRLVQGEDVTVALDVRLQHILHREVTKAFEDFDAIGGSGVIMDVNTGEVLAGISLPDFNPHQIQKAAKNALFNRLSLGVYELGSVFKIFSTAALLDHNKSVTMGTTFDAREPIKVGRFTINDYHAEDRVLTLPEVFMHSSNIGSALMGQALGTDNLRNYYRQLGLLDPLDTEILETGKPLLPNPWREVSTLTASYGHGLATTPLHVAQAVAAVSNGGYKVRPTFMKSPENDLKERILSPQTSQKMRALMRLVVSEGTGSKADAKGFQVGGKTGTAEKIGASGGYDKKRLISSFVGVFPAPNPQYLVMVMIDEPKGNKKSFGYATAGWVAAPAAQRIVDAMASTLGLMPYEQASIGAPNFADSLKQYVSFIDE